MSPLPLAVPLAVSISGTARVVVLCGRVVGSTVVLCSVTGTAAIVLAIVLAVPLLVFLWYMAI